MTTNISRCNQFLNSLETFQPKNKKEWAALSLSCATLLISSGAALAAGAGYVGYKWATAEKLGNPNAVQTIYTPPRPTQADKEKLQSHAEKIEKLKKDPRIMGIAFAADKNENVVPLYIRYIRCDSYTVYFSAHAIEDDVELGFAITHPFISSNNYMSGYWLAGVPSECTGYGSNSENVSKVLLQQVQNNSSYKNIGVILNKAIHQKFASECEGRILIQAVRITHPYHYKLGFRSLDSEQNRVYARYANNHQIPKKDLGSVYMHLPDQARQLWLKEVKDHPITFFS